MYQNHESFDMSILPGILSDDMCKWYHRRFLVQTAYLLQMRVGIWNTFTIMWDAIFLVRGLSCQDSNSLQNPSDQHRLDIDPTLWRRADV